MAIFSYLFGEVLSFLYNATLGTVVKMVSSVAALVTSRCPGVTPTLPNSFNAVRFRLFMRFLSLYVANVFFIIEALIVVEHFWRSPSSDPRSALSSVQAQSSLPVKKMLHPLGWLLSISSQKQAFILFWMFCRTSDFVKSLMGITDLALQIIAVSTPVCTTNNVVHLVDGVATLSCDLVGALPLKFESVTTGSNGVVSRYTWVSNASFCPQIIPSLVPEAMLSGSPVLPSCGKFPGVFYVGFKFPEGYKTLATWARAPQRSNTSRATFYAVCHGIRAARAKEFNELLVSLDTETWIPLSTITTNSEFLYPTEFTQLDKSVPIEDARSVSISDLVIYDAHFKCNLLQGKDGKGLSVASNKPVKDYKAILTMRAVNVPGSGQRAASGKLLKGDGLERGVSDSTISSHFGASGSIFYHLPTGRLGGIALGSQTYADGNTFGRVIPGTYVCALYRKHVGECYQPTYSVAFGKTFDDLWNELTVLEDYERITGLPVPEAYVSQDRWRQRIRTLRRKGYDKDSAKQMLYDAENDNIEEYSEWSGEQEDNNEREREEMDDDYQRLVFGMEENSYSPTPEIILPTPTPVVSTFGDIPPLPIHLPPGLLPHPTGGVPFLPRSKFVGGPIPHGVGSNDFNKSLWKEYHRHQRAICKELGIFIDAGPLDVEAALKRSLSHDVRRDYPSMLRRARFIVRDRQKLFDIGTLPEEGELNHLDAIAIFKKCVESLELHIIGDDAAVAAYFAREELARRARHFRQFRPTVDYDETVQLKSPTRDLSPEDKATFDSVISDIGDNWSWDNITSALNGRMGTITTNLAQHPLVRVVLEHHLTLGTLAHQEDGEPCAADIAHATAIGKAPFNRHTRQRPTSELSEKSLDLLTEWGLYAPGDVPKYVSPAMGASITAKSLSAQLAAKPARSIPFDPDHFEAFAAGFPSFDYPHSSLHDSISSSFKSMNGSKSTQWTECTGQRTKAEWMQTPDAVTQVTITCLLLMLYEHTFLRSRTPAQLFELGVLDPECLTGKDEMTKRSKIGTERIIWCCSARMEATLRVFHDYQNKGENVIYQTAGTHTDEFPTFGSTAGSGHHDDGIGDTCDAIKRMLAGTTKVCKEDAKTWDLRFTRALWMIDARRRAALSAEGGAPIPFVIALMNLGLISSAHLVVVGNIVYQVDLFGIMGSGNPDTCNSNCFGRQYIFSEVSWQLVVSANKASSARLVPDYMRKKHVVPVVTPSLTLGDDLVGKGSRSSAHKELALRLGCEVSEEQSMDANEEIDFTSHSYTLSTRSATFGNGPKLLYRLAFALTDSAEPLSANQVAGILFAVRHTPLVLAQVQNYVARFCPSLQHQISEALACDTWSLQGVL
jgi:hypothetical protein